MGLYAYKVEFYWSDEPEVGLQKERGLVAAKNYNDAVAKMTDWYGEDELSGLVVEAVGENDLLDEEGITEVFNQANFAI